MGGNIKRTKLNAYLLMTFIMIPSLTLPLKSMFDSGLPVYVATIAIIGTSLFINHDLLKNNKRFFIFSCVIVAVYLINYISVDYKNIVISEFTEFMKFGFIVAYLAYQEFSFNELSEAWLIVGIINVFSWIVSFESVLNSSVSYMFFGNTIVYSYAIFVYFLFDNKNENVNKNSKRSSKIFIAGITILIGVAMVLFANRGAILTAGLITGYMIIRKIIDQRKRFKIKPVVTVATVVVLLAAIIDLKGILLELMEMTSNYLAENGLSSYAINKFILQMEDGIASAASGRDGIYELGWEIIRNSPIPRGIGYFTHVTGINYPHNILIDIYITMGYILGTLFIITLSYLLYINFKSGNTIRNDLVALFVIIALTKLMLSSSFVFDTMFWLLFALITKKEYIRVSFFQKDYA